MDSPFDNPPVIEEGGLKYIWRTNATADSIYIDPDNETIIYSCPTIDDTIYEAARIGLPCPTVSLSVEQLMDQGLMGVYSLEP